MTDNELSGQRENAVSEEKVEQGIKPEATESSQVEGKEEPEKLVPQSKVNEIVGAAKKDASDKAYEKAMREVDALNQLNKPIEQPQQQSANSSQPMTEQKIEEIIEKKATEKANLAIAQKMITELSNKFNAAKDKYEDFDETVGALNFVDNYDLIPFINEHDNSAAVAYELAKNPAKFASVQVLARTNPVLARRQFQELSTSIKNNQAAMRETSANEPLDQIKPSNTGADNGGLNTVRDLRNTPNLRG